MGFNSAFKGLKRMLMHGLANFKHKIESYYELL